jgi:DNA-binding transcriptional LysR family regulator
LDISSLQAFIAVARYQSFSKASDHLFVTQPAVSKRVASLETELDTQLFNRIARQISLTEAGKQLLPKAQELVDQAEELQRYASNLHEDVSGNLSIAIAHHIGLHRMPPILKAFNALHPKVNLDIRFEDSDQACHTLTQGDIEFAVITLPSQLPQSLIKEVLWQDDLSIVVGVDHALSKYSKVDLKHLSEHNCVLPTKENETHQIIQREFAKHHLAMSVQMETNNLETLKMLVGASLGWSLLPKTMLDASLKSLSIGVSLQRQLGVVLHAKRSLSNAAKALKVMLYLHADDLSIK